MKERLVRITEIIMPASNSRLTSTFIWVNPWYTCDGVWLPRQQRVVQVLRLAYLTQVLDAVVRRVTINMVNRRFGEAAVDNHPDGVVHIQMSTTATIKPKTQIQVITTRLPRSLHQLARLLVTQQAVLVVVRVVPLQAC